VKGVRVEVERLSVEYGGVRALHGLSLGVEPSELLALLGPSGCGKTTLLRAIAGLVSYDGTVRIDGRIVDDVPTYRRGIGMVFQDYALFPHRTVRENIAFGLAMHRVARDERARRVDDALALLKLDTLGSRYPRELSGGQQQRVALARTLVVNPAVLLLDEPLAALDKKLREEMQVELRQLQQRVGITTIFVTHDQEEALALADRVAVMQEGRIEQLAGPSELYEAPANRFVADFIGRSNVLAARVVECTTAGPVCRVGVEEPVIVPATRPVDVGQTLLVAVRPEKLRIFAEAKEAGAANVLQGTIEHVTYLGVLTQVRVQLTGGEIVYVVEANTSRQVLRSYAVGQRVVVAWHPADSIVLER
jgi:putative spermidine/putrescine transport system ATP-binding protein